MIEKNRVYYNSHTYGYYEIVMDRYQPVTKIIFYIIFRHLKSTQTIKQYI